MDPYNLDEQLRKAEELKAAKAKNRPLIQKEKTYFDSANREIEKYKEKQAAQAEGHPVGEEEK